MESQEQILDAKTSEIDKATDVGQLVDILQRTVSELMRSKGDLPHRRKTLERAAQYFKLIEADAGLSQADKMRTLRHFSKEALRIVIANRPDSVESVPPPPPPAATVPAAAEALTDGNITATDVLKPTAIETPDAPAAETFGSFAELFPAAICHRMQVATTFFQRHNPECERTLARPFMLSPMFDAKLQAVVRKHIIPRMFELSRSLSMLETTRQWHTISTEQFWDVVEEDAKIKDRVMAAWDAAWGSIKQVRQNREKNGERTTVLVAPKILLEIRAELEAGKGDDYDVPPIRNREIELFSSLLYDYDRKQLERFWNRLRQIYEQEMDRRWYQDKAREGALRDSLLNAFMNFTDQAAEFMALLCYFNFPHLNLFFLDRFTHNRGTTDTERNEKVPYLMRFLTQEGAAEVRKKEQAVEFARQAEIDAARKRQQQA